MQNFRIQIFLLISFQGLYVYEKKKNNIYQSGFLSLANFLQHISTSNRGKDIELGSDLTTCLIFDEHPENCGSIKSNLDFNWWKKQTTVHCQIIQINLRWRQLTVGLCIIILYIHFYTCKEIASFYNIIFSLY